MCLVLYLKSKAPAGGGCFCEGKKKGWGEKGALFRGVKVIGEGRGKRGLNL